MISFVEDGVYEHSPSKIKSTPNLCLDKVKDQFSSLYLKCVNLQFIINPKYENHKTVFILKLEPSFQLHI